MPEEIVIREARSRDRKQILSFTRNTFRWGDYLSNVWGDWLGSRDGKLLIAEVGGRAVGNLHVAFLGEREAWFEGMRVHPKYRKLGIAARLDARAREMAVAAGCRVVRLQTASDNHAAQSALARFGYHRILTLRGWAAPSLKGDATDIRLAKPGDIQACMSLWEQSWMRRASRSLMPQTNPWHWRTFSRRHLRSAVVQGSAWVTPAKGEPHGFALVSGEADDFEGMMFVGKGPVVRALLRNMRMLAGKSEHAKCLLSGPYSVRFDGWASAEGYRRRGGGALIYERAL